MVQLTGANFDKEVLQDQPLPVLVLWGARDVNTTKIYLQMIKLDETKVKITQVYVDDEPALAMKYSIRDVPLVVLFIHGMIVAQDTTLSEAILKQVE